MHKIIIILCVIQICTCNKLEDQLLTNFKNELRGYMKNGSKFNKQSTMCTFQNYISYGDQNHVIKIYEAYPNSRCFKINTNTSRLFIQNTPFGIRLMKLDEENIENLNGALVLDGYSSPIPSMKL